MQMENPEKAVVSTLTLDKTNNKPNSVNNRQRTSL